MTNTHSEIVRTETVTKTYGEGETAVKVLHGIDLTLYGGEVTLIMGPSGSGKTTLVSILGCLLKPTGGRVVIEGQDVTGFSQDRLSLIRRDHVAFVFQAFNLFESLTAQQNVELSLGLAGMSKADARDRARELLEQVELSDRLTHVPGDLSGGQQQRVAIARALGAPGRLLLADEPTGALDSKTGRTVLELLRAGANNGRAVVVVTHDPRLRELADRIVTIEDGRIQGDERLTRTGQPKEDACPSNAFAAA